jgi:hypothetical protein
VAPHDILRALEALAARIGVAVRSEPFDLSVIEGRGGLCRLRGEPVVVMDARLSVLDKIGVLASALAAFDLEAIYVPPLLRASINRRRRGSVRPVAQPSDV